MNRKSIIPYILFSWISVLCHAQTGRMFTVERELSSSMVNSIYQSHDNIVWIATEDGLNKYDGAEKGQMNPSFLILKALAKVLPISLDSLINPDVSPEDEGAGQMKMLYCSCPSEMRETLLHHTQETMKELTELSEKFETN